MKKATKQLNFMCGKCHQFFNSENAVRDHAKARHIQQVIRIYQAIASIDLYNDEPSLASRTIEAELDQAMGLETDDEWLLGR